jgi:hypothetical protein
MKTPNYLFSIIAGLIFLSLSSFAQDKKATMNMSFGKEDSINVVRIKITSEDKPVKEINVKLYVQRLFSQLPVGDEVTTDENGVATFNFPNDIPGDENGHLTVIAKVEDDDNYGSFDTKANVKLGIPKVVDSKMGRSLSGNRANAPIYFIIVSNLIIIGIWGTLIYVISQIFKIRRISKHLLKNKQ